MTVLVPFRQPRTGETRAVKVGWSWTLFFFAGLFGLPLFLRRMYVWGFVLLILWVASLMPSYTWQDPGPKAIVPIFMFGLQIWLAIKGNEMTAKNYLEQGWEFAEPQSEETRLGKSQWGITV